MDDLEKGVSDDLPVAVPASLRVFLGYQFKSLLLSRTTLLNKIVDGIERVEGDINQVHPNALRLEIEQLDLLSSKDMGRQILSAIERADICIFELSDLNLNVMYEMGYAVGLNKPSLYLLHEAINFNQLPSDIRGDYVQQYREDRLDVRVGRQLKLVLAQVLPELQVE